MPNNHEIYILVYTCINFSNYKKCMQLKLGLIKVIIIILKLYNSSVSVVDVV